MKNFEEIEKIIKRNKKELNERYGMISIGIFGSYSRGEQSAGSDLDLLVEVQRPMGFVKFIRLENHLTQLLGVKVDMVTKRALKPYIGKQILQEVQYLLEELA
jgi:predicted nucleotidyltransferase